MSVNIYNSADQSLDRVAGFSGVHNEVLTGLDECIASTKDSDVAGAKAVKELNNNFGGIKFRNNDGKVEWSPVGADTWSPFKSDMFSNLIYQDTLDRGAYFGTTDGFVDTMPTSVEGDYRFSCVPTFTVDTDETYIVGFTAIYANRSPASYAGVIYDKTTNTEYCCPTSKTGLSPICFKAEKNHTYMVGLRITGGINYIYQRSWITTITY